MNAKPKQTPLISPVLRWFMLAMVLANIASSLGVALIPLYLDQLGASITEIGFVFTLLSVISLVLQVFGGWISDSIGRLKAVAIGSVGGVISYFLIVAAPTWEWLILALAINRFPYALVGPSFGAFIAENSTKETRGRVYGVTDMIYQITGIIGPPVGGLIVAQYNYRLMFLVSAILYSTAAGLRIWMAATMVSPQQAAETKELSWDSFGSSIKTLVTMIAGGGVVTWIFLTDGVRDAAFSLSREIEPLYLSQIGGLSTQQIGLIWSIFSISMLATPLVSGKLTDKHGERVPISAGFFLIFLAFCVFLAADRFIIFILVWVIFGLGVGLLSPAYSSLISKVIPHERLGAFHGLFYGSMGLIALPAPYLGTLMWEKISPQSPFVVAAAFALLTIIPIWFKFKVPEDSEEPSIASSA